MLGSAFCAIPLMARAQTADRTLPPVTVEAPREARAARPAAARAPKPTRTAAISRRQKPAATPAASPNDSGDPNVAVGTLPVVARFQLPQKSFSITDKQIDETINLRDPEDAVKYMPGLFCAEAQRWRQSGGAGDRTGAQFERADADLLR